MRERIGYISTSLKNLAQEIDVPVLAACQLNRAVEMREGNRPRLGDLKESGDIEQDADVVLLLHRPEMYQASTENKGILEIRIAKTRQLGIDGIAKLAWRPKYHRYGDYFNEGKD